MRAKLSITEGEFNLPNGDSLLSNVTLQIHEDRMGLVGNNGTGKSTLLNILSGQLEPTKGYLTRLCSIGYLPQHSDPVPRQTIADLFEIKKELDAMQRLESGEFDQNDFELAESYWHQFSRIESIKTQFDISRLEFTRPLDSLSGGELTRCRLMAILQKEPEILLLDEPTNHLDRQARSYIYSLIQNWKGGLIVASHDKILLEYVDRIAEITHKGLKFYSGNYQVYRETREIEDQAKQNEYQARTEAAKRSRKIAILARDRQMRRNTHGTRNAGKQGLPRVLLGKRKRQAENTTARLKTRHEQIVSLFEKQATESRKLLSPEQNLKLDVLTTQIPKSKIIAKCEGVNVIWPGQRHPLWSEPVSFDIYGPERIVVTGPNGSGKSTLLNLMYGKLQPTEGVIEVSSKNIGHLDQLNRDMETNLSVLDHMKLTQGRKQEHELRTILARYGISRSIVSRKVGELSGGERLRCLLASLLGGERKSEILLLDEPTNNLDLESQDILTQAVEKFLGVLMVVSHDDRFLTEINITRELTLPKLVHHS